MYQALLTGVRDYVRKNGFADVVIGLSGGIDSSLVAVRGCRRPGLRPRARRVDAVPVLERGRLVGRRRPGRATWASTTGSVPIEPAHTAFLDLLAPHFAGLPPGLTEENLQSRIRGVILMALSNKLGWLVLTTGNKSEVAVGYSTLYGDTAGGFAVIKDVSKTLVYRLCAWRNEQGGGAGDPASRPDQAAVSRAAPRPAGRPEPAALRGARSHSDVLRGGRPDGRRSWWKPATTPSWFARWSAWSTWPSTNGARRHRACGSRPRPSAATAGCRSPTVIAECTDRCRPPTQRDSARLG